MNIREVLAELDRTHQASTQGAWERVLGSALVKGPTGYNHGHVAECEDNWAVPPEQMSCPEMMAFAVPNAKFIVAAHNHLPALLAYVRALEAVSGEVLRQTDNSNCPLCYVDDHDNDGGERHEDECPVPALAALQSKAVP